EEAGGRTVRAQRAMIQAKRVGGENPHVFVADLGGYAQRLTGVGKTIPKATIHPRVLAHPIEQPAESRRIVEFPCYSLGLLMQLDQPGHLTDHDQGHMEVESDVDAPSLVLPRFWEPLRDGESFLIALKCLGDRTPSKGSGPCLPQIVHRFV